VSLPLPQRVEETLGHHCSCYKGVDDLPSFSCRQPIDPAAAAAVAAAPAWWKGGEGGVVIGVLLFLWLAVLVRVLMVALLLLLCTLLYIPGRTQGRTKPKHCHNTFTFLLRSLFFVLSPRTKKYTQTTSHTMANCHHHHPHSCIDTHHPPSSPSSS
jgi:hypothetical protein